MPALKKIEKTMFEFKKLRKENLELIFQWRLKPFVTKYQFTDLENDYTQHLNWFERISKNPSFYYWVIHYQGKPIGVFNLSNLDFKNSRTNAGYYIGEEDFLHVGGIVPPYLYNYVFRVLKLNKIYGEVLEGNSILKMHLLHGYHHVGTFKEHIRKNNQYYDVHSVELMASDWLALKRYAKYTCTFEE